MRNLVWSTAVLALWAAPASAEWVLDNAASQISFVSTKAGTAAEVHRFEQLTGAVDDAGNVTISIDLNSVNTMIEIRDERMREMLFETERYPAATLAATVDMAAVEAIEVGDSTQLTTEAQLMVHGATVSLTTEMTVARLSESRIMVASQKPLIVNAGQVDLLQGVERLRAVAGLPTISPAVPVTYVLAFDEND